MRGSFLSRFAPGMLHEPLELAGICGTAVMLGKTFGIETAMNWSLSPLKHEGDEFIDTAHSLVTHLSITAQALGITRIHAPTPGFNAAPITQAELNVVLSFSSGITLHRNPPRPADVFCLKPGEAWAISPAGCAIIVASDGEKLVCAHAGRNSLVDPARVKGVGEVRGYESVVDTIVDLMINPDNIQVKVFGAIPPKLFPHPISNSPHAEYNRLLRTYLSRQWGVVVPEEKEILYPDLPQLIYAQLTKHGVPDNHIDLRYAFLDPEAMWTDGTPGAPRNFFLVTRT